jgi:hypothetical protein
MRQFYGVPVCWRTQPDFSAVIFLQSTNNLPMEPGYNRGHLHANNRLSIAAVGIFISGHPSCRIKRTVNKAHQVHSTALCPADPSMTILDVTIGMCADSFETLDFYCDQEHYYRLLILFTGLHSSTDLTMRSRTSPSV